MSTLAKIIYEETGISQSSAPDEYEEIASACRRFALHCDPRHPLTEERILKLAHPLRWDEVDDFEADRAINFAQAIERAHGIGGEA